ncbi:hypothetical protein Tco_0449095 [Tanacetum coccineum]
MENLKYSDKHNMVAFLKKPNGSDDFHEIVDFLKRTPLRYALTHNPTIYDSLVKQFWQTATVRTIANGNQELLSTIDSKAYTITKAFVRSSLQLVDATGITNLPDAKIHKGLATMRDPTLTPVADEATTTSVEVDAEGAATTTASLDAGLDSGNIHESPLRLQAQLDAEVAEQILYNEMIAKRMEEEVGQENAMENVCPEEDLQQRMNQGTWKLSQLKKLTCEEIKEKFDKLTRTSKKQKTVDDLRFAELQEKVAAKDVPVTEEKTRETRVPKEEEEDSETDKEEDMEAIGAILVTTESPNITRDDLTELYRLVMQKYGENRPEDVYDRQKMLNWRYYDSYGVHYLTLEAAVIYMLTERKYPLSSDACQAYAGYEASK